MPNILSLGTPGTTPGISQAKLANRFIVTFQGIGGIADSSELTRNCISFTKPSVTFNEIEQNRYNSKSFVAGKYNWDPVDFVVEDTIDNGAAIILKEQIDKQITLLGGGTVPLGLNAAVSGGAYKFTTQLLITKGDGADSGEPSVIERWTLQGCWLTTVGWGDVSWEDDAATQISVNMRFDHATPEYTNDSDPVSALVGA